MSRDPHEVVVTLDFSRTPADLQRTLRRLIRSTPVQKPSIARTVIAHVDPSQNNGSPDAPAVITRVWGEHPDGGWTVNLRVLTDTSAMPLSLTSVRLVDEKPAAAAAIGTAWWPPRI